MSPQVLLLLGRAPSARSVLPEVVGRLEAGGARVATRLLSPGQPLPPEAPDADLLVLRDLEREQLRAAAVLERSGVPTCNSAAAHARSLDKLAVLRALQAAGVPVPVTRPVAAWSDVLAAAADGPVVVKPRVGEQGAGVLLLDGPAPARPPASGPWLVQQRVPTHGPDRKLYVVGRAVDGVLRRWPAPADRAGEPFAPEPRLVELARTAARALGLEICGIDVVDGPHGPVVVDANAFPGAKGVLGAAERMAEHLLQRARAACGTQRPAVGEVAPCAS